MFLRNVAGVVLSAGLQAVATSRGPNSFRVALRLFCSSLDMSGLNPSRSELLFEDASWRKNICSLFNFVQVMSRKLFDFE